MSNSSYVDGVEFLTIPGKGVECLFYDDDKMVAHYPMSIEEAESFIEHMRDAISKALTSQP